MDFVARFLLLNPEDGTISRLFGHMSRLVWAYLDAEAVRTRMFALGLVKEQKERGVRELRLRTANSLPDVNSGSRGISASTDSAMHKWLDGTNKISFIDAERISGVLNIGTGAILRDQEIPGYYRRLAMFPSRGVPTVLGGLRGLARLVGASELVGGLLEGADVFRGYLEKMTLVTWPLDGYAIAFQAGYGIVGERPSSHASARPGYFEVELSPRKAGSTLETYVVGCEILGGRMDFGEVSRVGNEASATFFYALGRSYSMARKDGVVSIRVWIDTPNRKFIIRSSSDFSVNFVGFISDDPDDIASTNSICFPAAPHHRWSRQKE